jgi:N-acetylneuraminic acid mutarotase
MKERLFLMWAARKQSAPKVHDVWESGTAMLGKRCDISADITTGGIAICAGGEPEGGGYSAANEVYDTALKTWTSKANMSPATRSGRGIILNDVFHYLGGNVAGAIRVKNHLSYSLENNEWGTLASLNQYRQNAATAGWDGKIYIVGGFDGNLSALATVEIYNPDTDTWSAGVSMFYERTQMGAAVLNGKLYVFGGYKPNSNQEYHEVFDFTTNSWATKAALGTAKRNVIGASGNGQVYCIGGQTSAIIKTVEAYDPETDTWSAKTDIPTVTALNGCTLVLAVLAGVLHG